MDIFKAYPFEQSKVNLTPGSKLYKHMKLTSDYIISLDVDRLLYSFRTYAKLDTKGAKSYGGWEGPWSHIRGEFMGHYICGCINVYESLKNTESDYANLFKIRVNTIINELKKCQVAIGNLIGTGEGYPLSYGYLAAIPTTQLDKIEALENTNWGGVPYYVHHKTFKGLVSAYAHLKNEVALEILKDLATYFKGRLDKFDKEHLEKMFNTRRYPVAFYRELGGIQESILDLYNITKDPNHFELANKFDRQWFKEMLFEDRDELAINMEHTNSEFPCVSSMAKHYEVTGDEYYKTGILNFAKWMREGHTFPSGGLSGASAYPDYNGELFNYPNVFYHHINEGHSSESCCAHNMNKISDKAFSWTTDIAHANDYETKFVNVVMSHQNPKTGMFVYFQELKQGSIKSWGDEEDSFWCCYCSGIEAFTSLTNGAYYHKNNTLWINNYLDSTLLWDSQGLELKHETIFPENGYSKLTFNLKEAKELEINIRIPGWATSNISFKLNGKEIEISNKAGTYANIKREFSNGDILEFNFEFSLYTERMPDRPEYVAVKYGPNLLVPCTLPNATYVGTEKSLISSMINTGVPCEFSVNLTSGKTIFKPMHHIIDEVYNGYTIITSPEPEVITDSLIIGNEISENEHNVKTTSLGKAHFNGKTCFRGMDGILCFDLKVVQDRANYIKCLYWGSDISGNELEIQYLRLFDIQIFDESKNEYITFATQKLNAQSPNNWYDIIYPIPTNLTKDKSSVKIRFAAKNFGHTHGYLGRLFEKITTHTYSN